MVDGRATMDVAELVARYHLSVYRYAYRLTGSEADAEDLTQQVFLIAQEKLGQLRRAEAARSWLFAVLRSCFIKGQKRPVPVPAGSLRLNIENVPQKTPSEGAVDRERLQQALDDLPPKYRLVLAMFYFEDCSYREIADQLELPMGTVMSRLARAKSRLRTKLFEPEGRPAVDSKPGAAS